MGKSHFKGQFSQESRTLFEGENQWLPKPMHQTVYGRSLKIMGLIIKKRIVAMQGAPFLLKLTCNFLKSNLWYLKTIQNHIPIGVYIQPNTITGAGTTWARPGASTAPDRCRRGCERGRSRLCWRARLTLDSWYRLSHGWSELVVFVPVAGGV